MFGGVLRLLALACLAPALIHGLMGVSGDWLVGVAPAAEVDPSLDSQNRFYGVAFGIYAALLWLCASDPRKYAGILKLLFAGMFIAGCARGLAVMHYGWPSIPLRFLWATEIFIPPVLWFWLGRQLDSKPA